MTFREMTKKFGYLMAMDILMAVEKMAKISVDSKREKMPEEKRLQSALTELDKIKPIGREELAAARKAIAEEQGLGHGAH